MAKLTDSTVWYIGESSDMYTVFQIIGKPSSGKCGKLKQARFDLNLCQSI